MGAAAIEKTKEKKDIFVSELNQPIKGVSLWKDAWRRLKKNKMAMFGLVVVIVYAILSITAPILPIYSYKYQVIEHQYLPPSLNKTAGELLVDREETLLLAMANKMGRSELNDQERGQLSRLKEQVATETREIDGKTVKVHERRYILGTDSLGRDLLARIIYGGQVSIAIGVIGTITSVFIGIVIGALAGYLGGRVDYIITRVIDVMYGLPYMMLVIILMALFGRNILNLFFALAIVSWLTVARVVRGQLISLKNSEFVEAARSIGASTPRIVFRHLVPNTLGVIVVFSTLRIPTFIMLESFLSFLGLGVQAPFASWGSLVSEGVEGMNLYPWRLFFPAIAMVAFLFAMNFLGDGLRDALDPQSKNKL
ncbi:MAG: ABC transporter permease [Spirochaetales bacterium]|nr:ABC transporter permease [Spirochaetales bacterium]